MGRAADGEHTEAQQLLREFEEATGEAGWGAQARAGSGMSANSRCPSGWPRSLSPPALPAHPGGAGRGWNPQGQL